MVATRVSNSNLFKLAVALLMVLSIAWPACCCAASPALESAPTSSCCPEAPVPDPCDCPLLGQHSALSPADEFTWLKAPIGLIPMAAASSEFRFQRDQHHSHRAPLVMRGNPPGSSTSLIRLQRFQV